MFGVYGIDLQILDSIPSEYQIQNNTIPSNIDPSTLSFQSKLLLAPLAFFASNLLTTVGVMDNGETRTIGRFWRLDTDLINPALTAVEMVLIRLNTDFTPSGNFPVHLNASGTRIGYDAAVCVQRWDPWIVETSNATTSSPSVVGIIAKGSGANPPPPSGKLKGHPITNNTRYLNVTRKDAAFRTAYNNSIGQMIKDNGRRGSYIPSPTVGPIVPPRTIFPLTPTYSAGCFSHQWHYAPWIHGALPRPARHHPRTDHCSQRSTVPSGVGIRRRTIVQRSNTGLYHL